MKTKKIGLLFFDPFSINKGTAALAYSIVYLLEEVAKKNNSKFQYIFLEPGKPDKDIITNYLEIENKKIPVEMRRCFPAHNFKQKILKALFFKDYPKSLQIDYVLDIGEGDSYSDIYGKDRFLCFDAMKRVYLKKHIPFVLLPQTVGPFNNKAIEKRATKTLRQIPNICVRDVKTESYIKTLISSKDILLTPDIAFYMPYKKQNFDSSKIHVGLNISGLLWYGGYTQNNQFNLTVDYQNLIIKLIEYFLKQQNVVLHLIPHVVHEKNTIDNDYPISYALYNKYKQNNLILAPFFMTPIDAKSYISGMDFFTGARLHATIGAFSSCVPVVPMAYSRKCTGLYEDTFSYNYVCNLMNSNTDDAFKTTVDSFIRREEIENEIKEIIPVIDEKKILVLQMLEKVLNK